MGNITMVSERGVPLMCETEGCGELASSVWSGGWDGTPKRCCGTHNPMAMTTALPPNFTSQSLCHACGQPVRITA